jgi:predicted MFS family arabinose efflux permease
LASAYDTTKLLFAAFLISGPALLVVPSLPNPLLVGVALFFYGLANGVISPMQKSLLTQNAPRELRGGIVSFDRLLQQVSKTTSTSLVGVLLVTSELSTIFWLLGTLSIASVVLMALLLRPAVSSAAA